MKVVVENLIGALFYAQLDNDATVADLKREIDTQQKLPFDRLILILDADADRSPLMSKEHEDRSSLVDCGVQDGSHIYLFFNPLDDHFGFNRPDSFLG
ncbi:hypothetical protein L6164_022219 [Bauhinia variegata]|uniref:Uncharacterized protein n=1 Tax=Bauhinia variegata TaxID=167791 RepID=A0ACB9MHU6_BAUVA|nr:hypothetical protein L6164_022219 [Bauhinia variegata]